MNERIRELAKQADIHFSKSGTLDAGPNGIAKFVLYADLEKFAELIVQECGKVYIQNQQDGVMTLTQDLLQHFGVEP